MTSIHIKTALQANFSSSRWLIKALDDMEKRDICDALKDCETLKIYLEAKAKEMGLPV